MQRRHLLHTLWAAPLAACGGGQEQTPPEGAPGRLRTLGVRLARADHVNVTMPDGQLLVTGGSGAESAPPSRVLAFDAAQERFVERGELLTGRFGHSACAVSAHEVLVFGGMRTVSGTPTAELLDLRSGRSRPTAAQPFANRQGHSATALPDGRVLVIGGRASTGSPAMDTVELFDPQSERFTPLASRLTHGRSHHAAVWLDARRLLVLGGRGAPGQALPPELFDLASMGFVASLPNELAIAPRQDAAALRSADGRALLIGGADGTGAPLAAVVSAGVGAPAQALHALGVPRRQPAAAALADGRVLVTGGDTTPQGGTTATTELFDPASGRTVAGPSMVAARAGHTADRLPDGRVLIVGGYGAGGALVDAVELFS